MMTFPWGLCLQKQSCCLTAEQPVGSQGSLVFHQSTESGALALFQTIAPSRKMTVRQSPKSLLAVVLSKALS